MERKTLTTYLILITSILPLITSAQKTFEKTFGGPNEDWAQTAVSMDDSGYIFTGITYTWGHGGEDFLMVRINKNGDTLWTKTFGGPKDDYGYRISKMHNGGYLIVGHTDSFGAGDCDGYVVRTNAYGDTIWAKTYGGIDDDRIHGAVELNNGDLVMVGWTENFGAIGSDILLLRTDSSGNTKWIKAIGGNKDDIGECINLAPDGNLIIGGQTQSYGNGASDFIVIKADLDGNIIWQKTYGTPYDDNFWSMQPTADGGEIMAGYTYSADSLYSQCYIVKINEAGEMKWSATYGTSSCVTARYINKAADGGYLVAGDYKTNCTSNGDVLLLKLDSTGTVLWQKTFGGPADENGNFVTETMDSNILVLGRTVSFGAGWSDCYIIKTDNSGNALTSINNLPNAVSFSIYPNPSYGQLNISTKSKLPSNSYIEITDQQGNQVMQKKMSASDNVLNIKQLAAGIYCYSILDGISKLTEGKFVLVK